MQEDRGRRQRQAETIVAMGESLDLAVPEVVAVAEGPGDKARGPGCRIVLENRDAISMALDHPGTSVCVLVFCSNSRPGGGWLNGAQAQEEDIALCSTWALQADRARDFYLADKDLRKWGSDGVLWASPVRILCDSALVWLGGERPVSMAGVTAPNMRGLEESRRGDAERRLAERLAAALACAERAGIEVFVGGAIGCGVFGHDPSHVAAMWKALAETGPYSGDLVLALPGPPDDRNLAVFRAVFGTR